MRIIFLKNKRDFIIYLKLFSAAFLWGGTFIAARILSRDMDAFSAAFVRFIIAGFFLVLLCRKRGESLALPSFKKIAGSAVLGLSGIFFYNYFFFSGLKYIEAGRASVIVANNPICIAFFSWLLFKEKMSVLKITGILISITGAVIVVTKGDPLNVIHCGIGKGELYIFGTVASWVTYSIVGKAFLKDFSPLQSVTISVLWGILFLFIPAFNEGVFSKIISLNLVQWASLFYLGVFGTVVAFVYYYQGLDEIGPTRAGLFINFVPVSGVFLSFLILGENLTLSLFSGLILVSLGVYLTNKK